MGASDLTRSAVSLVRRARIALLLVAATLVAEGIDLAVVAHAERVPFALPVGAELVSCLVGLVVAAAIGLWLGADAPARLGRWRVLRLSGALLSSLVLHELTALGLDAEHGAGIWDVAAHVGSSVLPIALVLGAVLALLVGAQVVRRAVLARRTGAPWSVAIEPVAVRVAFARRSIVAGLLAALRVEGRAPPVLQG